MQATHFLLAGLGTLVLLAFVSRGRVRNRERAAGVVPKLESFLDWWDEYGPFAVLVAPEGGVRTDAAKQASYYASGASKARTLEETPHGRAGAVDLWPVGFDPSKPVTREVYERFLAIGRAAESFGLVWGGRWLRAFPPSSSNPFGGDLPHVEVDNWAALPYPPQRTA